MLRSHELYDIPDVSNKIIVWTNVVIAICYLVSFVSFMIILKTIGTLNDDP